MKTAVAALGKALIRTLGVEYCCFRVFSLDLDSLPEPPTLPQGYRCAEVTGDEVREARQPTIQSEAWYSGEDALGFGVFFGSELVALQWIWFGEGYRRRRNFWPLERNEAKSVELVTAPEHRGLGLATCLKQFSARQLAARGFVRVYSRIWWNNWPSIRVSEKAGWKAVALVVELKTPLRSRPFRFQWRLGSTSARNPA
ncbi:GNAT family N-acetyltransferase [Dechloromonas sp. H13]|uniref:GNAT family N-acetyltransferase n=1 Tax=Dechloromonas sp. H13 TaxID=2570193 RepID=UPI0012924EF9|nr:GNAT family N-acetyltransferase [Dechloromonas sp. H13]